MAVIELHAEHFAVHLFASSDNADRPITREMISGLDSAVARGRPFLIWDENGCTPYLQGPPRGTTWRLLPPGQMDPGAAALTE